MIRSLLYSFAAILLLSTSLKSTDDGWHVITIIPKQEASRDSSLVTFLDSLEEAVLRRDSIFIFDHLHEHVLVSHGYSRGEESFTEYWKPFDSTSDLWPNMLRSIRQGGGWSNTMWVKQNDISFQMPYRLDPRDYVCSKRSSEGNEVNMKFMEEEGGAFIEDTLRLFVKTSDTYSGGPEIPWPDPPSPTVLQQYGFGEEEQMIRAYLPNQKRGFILCRDIKSPAQGCQLYFYKTNNKWEIICCMGRYSDLRRGN